MATHEFAAGAATIILPLAGGAAAIGVALAVFAWRRSLVGLFGLVLFIGIALMGGAALALLAPVFTMTPQVAAPATAPATPASGLAQRADALLGRAIAPNSPLACVDSVAGSQVEEACEAIVFARPETISAAVSYVMAKVALLAQARTERVAEGESEDAVLALLRHNLAADRYGIVAHVLEVTYGCTAEQCDAFAVVQDPAQIKANLRDSRFDRLVAKHAAAWPAAGENPGDRSGAPKAGSTIDFPSAADIPPVSIMVPETSRQSRGSGRGRARSAPKPDAKPRLPASRPAQVPAAAPAAPASGTNAGSSTRTR